MRNRAKCRECGDILESFHRFDYVECKCGEIGISGGTDKFEVFYKKLESLIRIGDNDEEIRVMEDVTGNPEEKKEIKILSQEEKTALIEEMIEIYENLPLSAKQQSASLTDFEALLYLIKRLIT